MIQRLKDKLWYWAVKKLLGKRPLVYNAYIENGVVFADRFIGCWFNGPCDQWDYIGHRRELSPLDTPFVPSPPPL